MEKTTFVSTVTILVPLVPDQMLMIVSLVMVISVLMMEHVSLLAQMDISLKTMSVPDVTLNVQLVQDQPNTNVLLAQKPPIYKMENVLVIVTKVFMPMKKTTLVTHAMLIVSNVVDQMKVIVLNVTQPILKMDTVEKLVKTVTNTLMQMNTNVKSVTHSVLNVLAIQTTVAQFVMKKCTYMKTNVLPHAQMDTTEMIPLELVNNVTQHVLPVLDLEITNVTLVLIQDT
jgi:archaellum biogenesis ATPase FlaH